MFREKARESAAQVAEMLDTYPDIANNEIWTKTSLIQPFLTSLGYDTVHPGQVKLEVTTELGGRIDYVLTGESNAAIAVEAKRAGLTLSDKETNQLRSYFTFSEAVAAILTNGVDYWLFTDLHKRNVMDSEPYHRIDIRNLTDTDLRHLETLTRSRISQDAVHKQAQEGLYQVLIDSIVAQELRTPSPEFLRMVGKKAEIKPLNKANLAMLETLVTESIRHVLSKSAPKPSDPPPGSDLPPAVPPVSAEPTPDKSREKLTGGPKAADTKARFLGATLFGEALSVKNYKEVLTSVVADLQSRHSDTFDEVVRDHQMFRGRKHWKISKETSDLPSRATFKVGQHWVGTNLNAKDKIKRAHLFLTAFGHRPEDLVIHTKDDSPPA